MDKRDIYWCLSSEGLYSMATSHSGMVFSQIENRLSKYIVGKLVKLAKKRECEECIEYIKNNEQNPNQLQIAIFDLLMREYVWHMGEAVYKNKNDLKQSFRWFGAALPVLFGSVNEKRLNQLKSYREYGYMRKRWIAACKKQSIEAKWEDTLDTIVAFLEPIWNALCNNEIFFDDWMPELGRYLG